VDFIASTPQLKLRAIFIRRSATAAASFLRTQIGTKTRVQSMFPPWLKILSLVLRENLICRQPYEFAQGRLRLGFHEAFQF